jgi:hypothetical protein
VTRRPWHRWAAALLVLLVATLSLMALSVELQPRDGGFVKLGTQTDGGAGILPGSIEYGADLNEYGCLDASFRLKLNPKWPRNIIELFTPVVITDGSEHVWSGRIIAAPTTYADDAEVMVQCQGWGQHLKDDCTDREWIVSDLGRWQPYTAFTSVDLTNRHSLAAQVNATDGILAFTVARNSYIYGSKAFGMAVLDLGPNNVARALSLTYTSSNNTGAAGALFASTSASPDWPARLSDAISLHALGAGTTLSGSFATPGRYVLIFAYWNAGDATFTSEWWLKFSDIQVFTDASDMSGNTSILKASTVISETLDAVAPLISSDRSKITTTTTSIPNFPGSPGYRYGNELIDAANAIHGYIARLSPDPVPVFEFAPQPTDYTFVVGAGEYQLAEPAAQDGRGVYSRVISEYTDAAGVRGAESSILADSAIFRASEIQHANPNFATDTTGWAAIGNFTATAPSIARTTATYNSSPASVALTTGDGNTNIYDDGIGNSSTSFSDAFTAGKKYRMNVALKADASRTITVELRHGGSSGLLFHTETVTATTSWQTFAVDFVMPEIPPDANGKIAAKFYLPTGIATGTTALWLDDFYIDEPQSSIVERRGFTRTALRPMDARTTAATADALAQLELDNSQYPPFKGTVSITGRIRTKGGMTWPVSMIPCRVGDALLIEDLVDPNTGALGRSGIIQRAKYIERENRVELEIDSAQRFIAQLRTRLRLGV